MFDDLTVTEEKVEKVCGFLKKEFDGLRTGRASSGMVDNVIVSTQMGSMPLRNLASITVVDNQTLSVRVWDNSNIESVDKALRTCKSEFNPVVAGGVLRIAVHPLSGETRAAVCKIVAQIAEEARVNVRQVRRQLQTQLKKAKHSKEISEDAFYDVTEKFEKIFSKGIEKIDAMSKQKQDALMKT